MHFRSAGSLPTVKACQSDLLPYHAKMMEMTIGSLRLTGKAIVHPNSFSAQLLMRLSGLLPTVDLSPLGVAPEVATQWKLVTYPRSMP